jgi:hypothetical protein
MLAVRYFIGAECDTDQYLLVAKVSEKFTESKQKAQKFEVESFNLKKLYELKVRKQI